MHSRWRINLRRERKATLVKKRAEPTLAEILEGVDIVGTMLDQELPQLKRELAAIKAAVTRPTAGSTRDGQAGSDSDILAALTELKEMLEQQEQRLLKLDARLAQLEAEFPVDGDDSIGEVH